MEEKRDRSRALRSPGFAMAPGFVVLSVLVLLAAAACEGVTNAGSSGGRTDTGGGSGGSGGPDVAAAEPDTGQPPVCEPDCAGKECGDDGCGGSCGGCEGEATCEHFQCVAPDPCSAEQIAVNCAGRECGGDGCGGLCGTCGETEQCNLATATCACKPACEALQCGVDPVCGASCGECGDGMVCEGGTCVVPYPAGPYGTEVGDTIQNLVFYTPDGEPVPLENFYGQEKVIILGSAAGWCTVCRDEAVEFQEFFDLYDDKGLILIVTLFEDDRGNPIDGDYTQEWIDYFDLTYLVLQDSDFALLPFYDQNATPLNMVITTEDMQIRYRAVGYSAFQVNYWAKKFMFQ